MPRVTYLGHDGATHAVEVKAGTTLMEAAVRNNVPGIDAECGGACACATCHVLVDAAWRDRLPPPDGMETMMLEFAAEAGEGSRLACQIEITDALDGLVVRLPASQR